MNKMDQLPPDASQQLPLITRAQIVELVNLELGIPLTRSTLEKAAMIGEGPSPAARYGRMFLYEKQMAFAWARGLLIAVEK